MFNPETDLQLPKIMSQRQWKEVLKKSTRFAKQVHPRLTRSLLIATKNIQFTDIHMYIWNLFR